MSFLTISNENIFVKTRGTRLDAISYIQQKSRMDPMFML